MGEAIPVEGLPSIAIQRLRKLQQPLAAQVRPGMVAVQGLQARHNHAATRNPNSRMSGVVRSTAERMITEMA